ncbi:hypothetical protein, variant 1 [Sphaeroforma arctica JP610]|uniref:Uncharacterized protein n=1 Tax=Sphaeroforma arctica JP610 TaxID=667725 RepID=A0A0L0FTY6_9EUKA|nr:hypothetical protein, variant 1 [Sphaeroforma arctica JP610]KNC80109.1 hypothetical protein, variant 1 [Sphaeroforma arctica JP610]|eukprot:XP_014154011.1 hypothetical protein, variant 1 [Sphaeroforma arctica JP610]
MQPLNISTTAESTGARSQTANNFRLLQHGNECSANTQFDLDFNCSANSFLEPSMTDNHPLTFNTNNTMD